MPLPFSARGDVRTPESLDKAADERRAMALAMRSAAGDLAATQEFLSAIQPTLTRVATGVLGVNHPDLDDAVQQSLLGVLHALPAFRGECHPAGYASRIALRIALRVRKNCKRDAVRRDDLERLTPRANHAEPPTAATDAARRRELMRELLDELPDEQAEALTLRVVLGWTLEEVSRATGAPINTVRSRVRLAKEALRRRIEAEPDLVARLEVER